MAAPTTTEQTFSKYNQWQGKNYSDNRRDYHPKLYEAVMKQHIATGGQFDTVLDIGCGPGNVVRAMAPHFVHATGIDPSDGMLETARSLGGVTSTDETIHYERSTAEALGGVPDGSVDLIAAGNAAHWFDMPGFWRAAARALKPKGSVALWTSGDIRAHPAMPCAAAVQAVFERYEKEFLRPYFTPGNIMTRERYADLPLPWTLTPPIAEFDQSSFLRQDWDVGEPFFAGQPEIDLQTAEKVLSTSSPWERWRQAHPDDAYTERDGVKMMCNEVGALLREAGVEPGKEYVKGAVRGVVLVVKKI